MSVNRDLHWKRVSLSLMNLFFSLVRTLFSFRVTALDFQAPRMSKIMYKLDGFDADWLTIGESPIVTYSNLRYGNYTFKVSF